MPDQAPDIPAPAEPVDRVRALLSPTPISADELSHQAATPAGNIGAIILELEMAGEVNILPGGLLQVSQSS